MASEPDNRPKAIPAIDKKSHPYRDFEDLLFSKSFRDLCQPELLTADHY